MSRHHPGVRTNPPELLVDARRQQLLMSFLASPAQLTQPLFPLVPDPPHLRRAPAPVASPWVVSLKTSLEAWRATFL